MKRVLSPLVSVVMPVHNAGPFLVESMNSILRQSYKNLELIIVDDASTDDSLKVIKSFKDKRIRLFKNPKNVGISKSANLAVSKAKGDYLARMDADDISSLDRLEKQVAFLAKNKKVIAVGGQCDLINKAGVKVGEKRFPVSAEKVRQMIFSSVPLQQSTMMVALHRLPQNFVWYDDAYKSAEEIEMLFKFFTFGEVRNMNEKFLMYRIHENNTSLMHPKETFFLTIKTRIKAIFKYGYKPTLTGVMITLAQSMVVFLMPESWIFPVYKFIRNPRSFSVKLNIDGNFGFKDEIKPVEA